ncbi:MAG: hypothetical protein WCZ11_00695 [Bacilli bacterium]
MRKYLTLFWRKLFNPIWSFIINLIYWSIRLYKLKRTIQKKKLLLKLNIADLMKRFKWKEDNLKDWTPWIITIIDKEFEDDCDGAANLAKWWCKNNNLPAKLLYMYSLDYSHGHVICITEDNKIYISNSNVVHLISNDYRHEIIKNFGGKYPNLIF